MALFASHAILSTAWAEDEAPVITTVEITQDTTYGAENDTAYDESLWSGNEALNVTAPESDTKKHTICFDGTHFETISTYGDIISAFEINIQNLKGVTFTNFEGEPQYSSVINTSSLLFKNNGTIDISHNKNALSIQQGGDSNAVTFSDNDTIQINNNSAVIENNSRWGGALSTENLIFENTTGEISITNNYVIASGRAVGGAISNGEDLTFQNNKGNITISNNYVANNELNPDCVYGGAIFNVGTVKFDQNEGALTFEGNSATSTGQGFVSGGAISVSEIYADGTFSGDLILSGNSGNITFKDNSVNGGANAMPDGTKYPPGAVGGAAFTFCGISITDNTSELISFSGNTANAISGQAAGGALYTFSSITINANKPNVVSSQENSAVSASGLVFDGNSAHSVNDAAKGGAIASDNSVIASYAGIPAETANQLFPNSVSLSENGNITFSNNKVISGEVDENGNVISNNNSAYGGAIYSNGNVDIINNAHVNFTNNAAYGKDAQGGAIYSNGEVTITNNKNVNFSDNNIYGTSDASNGSAQGGAIYAKGIITISQNKVLSVSNNTAASSKTTTYGGAIYGASDIYIDENESVTFHGNTAKVNTAYGGSGGAIHSEGSTNMFNNGDIAFTENKIESTFSGGLAYQAEGGAIYAKYNVSIGDEGRGNGNVSFIGNESTNSSSGETHGGAITVGSLSSSNYYSASLQITHNKNVTFENNKTSGGRIAYGGAVYVDGTSAYVEIANNDGSVTFKNNSAISTGEIGSGGGAIHTVNNINNSATVGIYSNKGDVIFDGNQVIAHDNLATGGAIATGGEILIGDNDNVSIINNTVYNYADYENDTDGGVAWGGAFMTLLGTSHLSYNRGEVNVSNNGVAVNQHENSGTVLSVAMGGAMLAKGLSIVGNGGDVTFAGNYEYTPHSTVLRSLVILDGAFELAAASGKSISFYDAVYVSASDGNDVILNFYQDLLDGNVKASTGDIVFSGARTEQDLAAAQATLQKAGFEVSPVDIEASRTSIIERNINVATGGLRVEDGAVLKLHDGSEGYDLILVNGKEMGPQVGIEFKPELSARLEVSSGSRIEAANIDLGATAIYTSKVGLMQATTLSLKEATIPAAELQAATVTLRAGMTYNQDGAITLLVGDANTLVLDATNGESFIFNVDESLAYTQDENIYFVLFTGVEDLSLDGIESLDELLFMHNLEQYNDIALGFHDDTGTLYISAKSNSIPEPATATLSLLALAALAARRRRR